VPITGTSMKVHPSHTGELAPAAKAQRSAHTANATASRGGSSFASVHASAVAATSTRATKTTGVPGTDVVTPTQAPTAATGKRNAGHGGATVPGVEARVLKPIRLQNGEAMTAVSGHAYGEITDGKRDGMFVNTSSNARRGQAFVLVHKHGREYHIYGTGKDRVVVALKKRPPETDATTPAATTPAPRPITPTVTGTGATGAPTS
jgi:hypothetical protein